VWEGFGGVVQITCGIGSRMREIGHGCRSCDARRRVELRQGKESVRGKHRGGGKTFDSAGKSGLGDRSSITIKVGPKCGGGGGGADY